MENSLFRTTLLQLFRELKMSDKLLLLDPLLKEVQSTRIQITKLSISRYYNGELIDRGTLTEICGRILHKLDPVLFGDAGGRYEYRCGFEQRFRSGILEYYIPSAFHSHPYLLQVFRRLGKLAIPPDTDAHISLYDVPIDYPFSLDNKRRLSPIEIYHRYFEREKVKSPEEIDQIIDEYLRENKIEIDPERVKLEVEKLDFTDRVIVIP